MPSYAHWGDAGADMRADVPEPVTIEPMQSAWVGTGVRVAIPDGFVGLQFPRSGLGCNHGICLANGTGVIDSGYRGEIRAKLLNLGQEPFTVNLGDRVCQLVLVPYARAAFVPVAELPASSRGTDGYGSTGVR
uniref:dUTP diphosphatase n=2 Tax=root TaxID=1 RepID=A0A8S5SD30_9CAUD|nr:MAG TPA: dCTP deaminase dUTPase [Siphoviridae sp. ctqBc4]